MMIAATRELSSQAAAAKAIRAELKKAFPNTKFSVTSSSFANGDSVHIDWLDGPTTTAVEAITGKYQYGHFDGMIDLYENTNQRSDIPQSKYVQTRRDFSDSVIEQARKEIAEMYGKPIFADTDMLDWFEGGTWGNNAIYRYLSKKLL